MVDKKTSLKGLDIFNRQSQQIEAINKKIEEMGQTLIKKSFAVSFLKQPHITSPQKRGGFTSLLERFEQNEASMLDVIAVLRHAKAPTIKRGRSR